MASSFVVSTVAAAVAANWSFTPLVLPNAEGLVPDDGSAFLVLEFPPVGDESQITIGAVGTRVFREEGAFVLTLCVPLGTGVNSSSAPWLDRLDALRAALRGRNFANVNTLAATPPHENGESDRGAYYELAVAIPYYFDISGA